MNEWKVEGAHGSVWVVARDGDAACERVVARFRLTPWQHDALVVTDVRPAPPLVGAQPTEGDDE